MRLIFALVAAFAFMMLCGNSKAGNIIVTSNADSGPGTLRDAIQQAAANGNATTDFILFNLPDISRIGRTIILDSSLPYLSSHIIIDGTSQPGVFFGISNAKVQIENNTSVLSFTCFQAVQISDIEIYGLYIKGIANAAFAIQFRQVNNMRFGAPGKGNMVTGFAMAFYSDLTYFTDPASSDITFQSNLLGIDESGDTASYSTYNYYNFYLVNVKNLAIGGLGNNEGNLMCDNYSALYITCTRPENFGYLKLQGNKIGTDRTGLRNITQFRTSAIDINGYNDGTDDPMGTTDVNVEITNNICAARILLFKIKNYFKIQGNTFGVGADNISNINNSYAYSLFFEYCWQGIIGGPNIADKNYITYTNGAGVGEFHCGSITISKNSFFCNDYGISYNWVLGPRPKPFITINSVTPTTIGGTALPNSTIELFYDDACPGCEGKTYLATVTADNNGNWIYAGINTGGIVATATDTFGATSEFSMAIINTDSVLVTDATCGKPNGSIKKLRVISGTDWYWEDELGNITGQNTDLINVGPGKYKFVTSIGGNGCITESILYEVKNISRPVIDTSLISITQPSCGQNNGALLYQDFFNDSFQYRWLNNANIILSGDYSINNPFANLAPADYYLNIRLKQDSTCFTQYGPFILTNQSGPSLQTGLLQIGNSTCKKNNGFIKNLTYQNATGNIFTAWEDSTGKIVGNNLDLTGTVAGKYHFKFKDDSGCDTIVTSWFTVKDTGTIVYDTSYMVVKASSCKGADGSITGITSTNANIFTWINSATGNVVGNTEDISNVSPGSYELQLNNNFGCGISTNPVNVGQYGFLQDTVLDVAIIDANCDVNNGFIQINKFSNDTSLYSFEWTDSATNNIISRNTNIQNLSPGFYILHATDSNGCKQRIFAAGITQMGKPVFDTDKLQILDDTCNAGTGAIQNLLMQDVINSFTWSWYDGQQNLVANTANSIIFLHEGNYYATVTDRFNCAVKSNIFSVNNIQKTIAAPQVSDQYIPRNSVATISVINPQAGMYDLLGDNLQGSLPLSSSASGTFQTSLITADRSFYVRYRYGDCMSALSIVNIKVLDTVILYVPNAFTPNNDGLNDIFRLTYPFPVKQFHMNIYNQWGQKIFESGDIKNGWDGTYKGKQSSQGVYAWTITLTDYQGKLHKEKGVVTLLK